MNKFKKFIFVSVGSLAILNVDALRNYSEKHEFMREGLVELKGAYYLPTNHLFRKIYGSGSGMATLEGAFQLHNGLFGWISGSVFAKSGHSVGECNPTNVIFTPLGLGLKYLWDFRVGDLYIGAGALATFLRTKDCSPFVIPVRHNWGGGVIGKFGFLFDVPHNVFIDLFTDYSFLFVGFDKTNGKIIPHNAHPSGWSVGLGLGYRF